MGMASALRSVRIHAENERLKKGVENVIHLLATMPTNPVRVSTKVAKHILIQHATLFFNGVTYSTQVRNIGAGVKEIYLKERGLK